MTLPGRLLTAMVTPFAADGAVDLATAARLARHLVAQGSDGLVVNGTTGESPTLSESEREALLDTIIEAVGAERVVMGTGSNDTDAAVRMSRQAASRGVAGLLVIAPYYNKPDTRGLEAHFRAVSAASDRPIILYNHPPRTGVAIPAALVGRLAADCPTIVALKDSSASLDVATEILLATPPDFLLYSGNDSLTLPIMAVGGHGVISVASHVIGPRLRQLVDAAASGDFGTARRLHHELYDLMQGLFLAPSPAPVKAALAWTGMPVGGVRLPLVDLDGRDRQRLEGILRDAGLVEALGVRA
ncbi:MAG: 4-hydroxy-tetrahydrodipicolinate synthase [Candidatus Sericytochromatia bacterium]|nr:4-hydroxy-tetrahydrodipicolinate synthase [Candidatus Sericytochromatia bacterium]